MKRLEKGNQKCENRLFSLTKTQFLTISTYLTVKSEKNLLL